MTKKLFRLLSLMVLCAFVLPSCNKNEVGNYHKLNCTVLEVLVSGVAPELAFQTEAEIRKYFENESIFFESQKMTDDEAQSILVQAAAAYPSMFKFDEAVESVVIELSLLNKSTNQTLPPIKIRLK